MHDDGDRLEDVVAFLVLFEVRSHGGTGEATALYLRPYVQSR